MIDPDLVRHHPLFAGISAPAIALLAQHAVLRSFPRGTTLFRAGDRSRGLILLLEGRVRVARLTGHRARVVHLEERGGTLGEVPLYDDHAYPATAVAEEDTVVAIVDRDALGGAMRLDPRLAWALLGRMARRVRSVVDRLDALSGDTVRRRLVEWLLRHADRQGRIRVTQTQAQLADELGTAREVVVRELRWLRRHQVLVTRSRTDWRLGHRAALRDMGSSR